MVDNPLFRKTAKWIAPLLAFAILCAGCCGIGPHDRTILASSKLNAASATYELNFTPLRSGRYDFKLRVVDASRVRTGADGIRTARAILECKISFWKDEHHLGDCVAKSTSDKQFSAYVMMPPATEAGFYFCAIGTWKTDAYSNVTWSGCPPPWERAFLIKGVSYRAVVSFKGLPRFLNTFGPTFLDISPALD